MAAEGRIRVLEPLIAAVTPPWPHLSPLRGVEAYERSHRTGRNRPNLAAGVVTGRGGRELRRPRLRPGRHGHVTAVRADVRDPIGRRPADAAVATQGRRAADRRWDATQRPTVRRLRTGHHRRRVSHYEAGTGRSHSYYPASAACTCSRRRTRSRRGHPRRGDRTARSGTAQDDPLSHSRLSGPSPRG